MQDVKFVDRKTGETIIEQVPGGGMMRFLYSQNFLGRFLLWSVVKRRTVSVFLGWFMINPLSSKTVKNFVKKHKLDLSDYVQPKGGYKDFNHFFYRKLKPGARPISEGIITPADGKIVVFPTIAATKKFYIKGEQFDLNQFIGDTSTANIFDGGSMAVIRLAPTDYHRFHFPISGYVGEVKQINGFFYSVSPLALKQSMQIFWQNKREHVTIDSDDIGQVLVSEVGATFTGSIVQSHWPNIDVEKGDEKGFFAFGGSTVIVLFEKGKMTFSQDLLDNTKNGLETAVKMGETIGTSLNR